MGPDESPVGLTGVVTVATRGTDGPGEVAVGIRGGTESFLAYSERPLARGTEVVVLSVSGARAVHVYPVSDALDPALDLSEGD